MPNTTLTATFDLLSPLSHGAFGDGADLGNYMAMRQERCVSVPGAPLIPCVSGNAVRGVLRRILMRELLDVSRIDRASLSDAVGERHALRAWDRLYGALVLGGTIEDAEKSVNPERTRALRASLPPLSLFGSALYGSLLSGVASVGFAWPVCKETVECGLVMAGDHPAAEMRASDLLTETGLVRHTDRQDHDPSVSGVGPMPYTVEALATGSRLVCECRLQSTATPIEASCLAHGLSSLHAIGGKGSVGFGSVRVDLVGDASPDEYRAWIAAPERTTETKQALVDLAVRLSGKADAAD